MRTVAKRKVSTGKINTIAANSLFDCVPGCPVSVFVLDCGQMLEIDFTVIQVSSYLYCMVVVHI